MAKGSSGFDKGGNGKSFKPISLDGKTGTEKQKAYAESLAESARLTAKANGVSGIIKENKKMNRYVPKDDAEAVRAAYKFLSAAVENRKTYGDVISLLKNNSVLGLANDLKAASKKAGINTSKYVDDMLKRRKK